MLMVYGWRAYTSQYPPSQIDHMLITFGLWVSDDVKNKESLLANHEREKQASHYSCEKGKRTSFYKPCNGAVLEIAASGYVNYIEMDGVWAHSIYSCPITNWDGPDGVWTGCCVDCCFCCKKGCVHFDVEMPGSQIHVNGRYSPRNAQQRKRRWRWRSQWYWPP